MLVDGQPAREEGGGPTRILVCLCCWGAPQHAGVVDLGGGGLLVVDPGAGCWLGLGCWRVCYTAAEVTCVTFRLHRRVLVLVLGLPVTWPCACSLLLSPLPVPVTRPTFAVRSSQFAVQVSSVQVQFIVHELRTVHSSQFTFAIHRGDETPHVVSWIVF